MLLVQAVAQGRVWTGKRALERKLVDVLGGLHEAVALVKQAAGIEQSEKVTLVEVSRGRTSPLALIGEAVLGAVHVAVHGTGQDRTGQGTCGSADTLAAGVPHLQCWDVAAKLQSGRCRAFCSTHCFSTTRC